MDYHGFESTIGPSSLFKPLEPRPMGFGAMLRGALKVKLGTNCINNDDLQEGWDECLLGEIGW